MTSAFGAISVVLWEGMQSAAWHVTVVHNSPHYQTLCRGLATGPCFPYIHLPGTTATLLTVPLLRACRSHPDSAGKKLKLAKVRVHFSRHISYVQTLPCPSAITFHQHNSYQLPEEKTHTKRNDPLPLTGAAFNPEPDSRVASQPD